MNRTFVLTGGNLGQPLANLETALRHLSTEAGNCTAISSIYATEAWGMAHQPTFYNQVLALDTVLSAHELLSTLLHIEASMGRVREAKNGPRIIDIDILFFNDEIIESALLQVPHPRMAQRRFVLTPLAEIAPQFVHPVFIKTIAMLLAECTDPLAVHKLAHQPPWVAASFAGRL